MFQSKYKFSASTTASASKLAFQLRGKKRDILVHIGVPIAMLIMISILVYDIIKSNNIVFDIILIVALLSLEVLNFLMPMLVFKSQKKYLARLEAENFDYCLAEFDKGEFKEKFYKDKKMVYCNTISADKVVNCAEFEHYYIVIFNNYTALLFDLDQMEIGNADDLKAKINKLIETNKLIKPKKKK